MEQLFLQTVNIIDKGNINIFQSDLFHAIISVSLNKATTLSRNILLILYYFLTVVLHMIRSRTLRPPFGLSVDGLKAPFRTMSKVV